MVIAHNISALNTYKSLGIAGNQMQSSMEKLSSGYKINKAGDDAAGLSISEKMRSQIRGLNQASTNAENGVSMIQTAEGALNEEHAILQRMRELAVQSATDTNAQEDREALQSEIAQLTNEINRIGQTTEFNGMKILNGDKAKKVVDGVKATCTFNGINFEAVEAGVAGNKISILGMKDGSNGVTIDNIDGVTAITISINYSGMKPTAAEVKAALETNATAKGLIKVTSDDSVSAGSSVLFSMSPGERFAGGADGASEDKSVYFHVGANSNQVINTSFNDMRAAALGISRETAYVAGDTAILLGANGKYSEVTLDATNVDKANAMFASTANVNNGVSSDNSQKSLNISTRDGANYAIQIIDNAIKKVSEERSKYGAIQNRLEYTMNNLNTTAENMTAAESTIRDVDMAEEMMEYTKNNILQQAAQAMLVQANARPQQALQLLQ